MVLKESFIRIITKWVALTPIVVGIILLLAGFFFIFIMSGLDQGDLIASIAASYALYKWLVLNDFDFDSGSPIAAIGGVLGITGVMTASNVFKDGYTEVRVDLQAAFSDTSMKCAENSDLFNKGLQACSTAHFLDAMNLTNELAKARYLVPTLSLADGVYHSTDAAKVDACLVNYYLLSKKCPGSFSSFNEKHPEMTAP